MTGLLLIRRQCLAYIMGYRNQSIRCKNTPIRFTDVSSRESHVVMLKSYLGAICRPSAGDEWFKQHADEHATQQKRQYQLLMYCCPGALQRPDRTPT